MSGPYSGRTHNGGEGGARAAEGACYVIVFLLFALGVGFLINLSPREQPPETSNIARHRNAGF